jgi:hypothetical protein
MWEPRRLKPQWASKACYRDNFPFLLFSYTHLDQNINVAMFPYIFTRMSDSQRGFGLDIGFTDHLNTQLVTTLNYSAIANFHTLYITTAHAKTFQSFVTSRFPGNGF